MRLGAYLDQKPPLLTGILGIVLLAFIGLIDYATGPDLGLSIIYLAPILLVTHRLGEGPGVGMALLATATWLWADMATGQQYSMAFIHYWNAATRLGFFVIILFLVVALKRERLSARQDALTGAGNRQVLHEVLGNEIARVHRFRRPLSCALMDVDRFKAINDSLGHPEGDSILRTIAKTLRQHTRTIDVVTRLGGDEFVVLLPETGAAAAAAVVRRLQKGLDGLPSLEDARPRVTLSIGVVTFERAPRDADEVLSRADAALYAAKRMGGNTIEHEVVA
jgi:diguanylate cyclase (GGDEF)-like protein